MVFVELLPTAVIGAGGIVTGVAAILGGSKLVSLVPQCKKRIQEAQGKVYADGLLTLAQHQDFKFHSNMLKSFTADGSYMEFPTSVMFKRDSSESGKQRFEDHFKGRITESDIVDEVYDHIFDLLHYMIRHLEKGQLLYFQKDFEHEVGRRLQVELNDIGLEVTNFHLKCNDYNSPVLDLDSLKTTSFESIRELFPVVGSVKGPSQSPLPVGTQGNEASTNQSLSPGSLSERLNSLEDSWMEYEINPTLLLNYPLMSDASCEETAAFFVAMSRVKSVSTAFEAGKVSIDDFSHALDAAELTFVKAENNAKKMRHSYLTSDQRHAVEKARPLVAMYKNEAASPHERLSAFKQANNRLEGIIALPERPIMGLLETS